MTADKLKALILDLATAGDIYAEEVVVDPKDDPRVSEALTAPLRLGFVVFSVPAVARYYRAGTPRHDADPATVERLLMDSAEFRGNRLVSDVLVGMWLARREAAEAAEPTTTNSEMLDMLSEHRNRRNRRYRGHASLALLDMLSRPASDIIPDRPRTRIVDEVDSDDGLTFGAYIGAAIEAGDAQALDAIGRWMRSNVQAGPKAEDWPTILRTYRYTAGAIADLAQEWAKGADEKSLTPQMIVQTIKAAGLDLAEVMESPRRRYEFAREIVAHQYRVAASSIKKEWKNRKAHLPSGDQLIRE